MKSLYLSFLSIVLLLASAELSAQNPPLTYSLSSSSVSFSDQTISLSSTIETSESTITWIQYANGMVEQTSMLITNTSGSWDEQSSIGTLNYSVQIEEATGTLVVSGSSSGLSAVLNVNTGSETESYSFQINSITYL